MTSVLVLTNSFDDPHVDAVKEHVDAQGHEFSRVNVDQIVKGSQSLHWDFNDERITLHTEENSIVLSEVDSFWWRKPLGFGGVHGFVESIQDPVQRSALAKELQAVVYGLAHSLGRKFWCNNPHAANRASNKPYQIGLAAKFGLSVPESVLTSCPARAVEFCEAGPTVFKPLAETALDYQDRLMAIRTTLVEDRHKEQLHLIRRQPVLLQRLVKKSCELRVTYIDGDFFVARQTPTGEIPDTTPDWRLFQETDLTAYSVGSLPEEIQAKVHKLMQYLQLSYAAIDFAVTDEGEHLFLEVNPNGQWLGYTDMIGLPAAEAIASCLVNARFRFNPRLR